MTHEEHVAKHTKRIIRLEDGHICSDLAAEDDILGRGDAEGKML